MQNWRREWDYKYTLLLLCWSSWIAIYLCRSILAPILPVISFEFGLTHAQGGMLETAYLIGYVAVKIPTGAIANRIGIKKTLTISMVGYALATATNFFARDFLHFFTLRILIGLFQGVHLPLANTLLSERFGRSQGKAIGFHESGPNVGNSIAYPLTVSIASYWGWRYAFLILSLPAFALAGVATIILREEPPKNKPDGESSKSDDIKLRPYLRLLAPLALAHSIYNLCLRTLLTFAPSFLVEYRGMSLIAAGLVATLMPAAGFFAKVSSGFLAESLGRKNAISLATFMSALFIFTLTRIVGELPLSFNFIALGLTLYSFSPIIYASVTSGLPTNMKPIGLGTVTMIGNIFGALSTSFIGYLIDALGYPTAFSTIAGTVLAATISIYLLLRDNYQEDMKTVRNRI